MVTVEDGKKEIMDMASLLKVMTPQQKENFKGMLVGIKMMLPDARLKQEHSHTQNNVQIH